MARAASPDLLPTLRRSTGEAWPLLQALGDLSGEVGQPAHLVGGSVRDALLGRPVRDLDLVVEGDARRLARAAVERHGGTLLVHGDFGTARWQPPSGPHVDLASARAEIYPSPAALPLVRPASLNEDLRRRDFTINAMALALAPGERGSLRDPHGGAADLDAGLLRVLHPASFEDDPTRALRAARFAARFGLKLAPDTQALLDEARDRGALDRIGPERLGAELNRLLAEGEVLGATRLLDDWDLLGLLSPGLRAGPGCGPALGEALSSALVGHRGFTELRGEPLDDLRAEVLWLAIASVLPPEARAARARLILAGRAALRRWSEGPERVRELLDRLSGARRGAEAARALSALDEVERAFALGIADDKARDLLVWWEREGRLAKTAVDATTLMSAGLPQGPALGAALRAAQDAAWNGEDAKEQLRAALSQPLR